MIIVISYVFLFFPILLFPILFHCIRILFWSYRLEFRKFCFYTSASQRFIPFFQTYTPPAYLTYYLSYLTSIFITMCSFSSFYMVYFYISLHHSSGTKLLFSHQFSIIFFLNSLLSKFT